MTSVTGSRLAAMVLAGAVSFLSLRSAVAQRAAAPSGADVTATVAPSVVPPVPITRVDADSPSGVPAGEQVADVVLTVTVGVDGLVADVETIASGGAAFDSAATRAAWQWTFTPAQRDGQPVASRIRIPFHFAPP